LFSTRAGMLLSVPDRTKNNRPDELLCRAALGYEDADTLQRAAEISALVLSRMGDDAPPFAVSAFVVPGAPREGVAWRSAVEAAGFEVIDTPQFGDGHRTIVLRDPVDEEQARQFNRIFGRSTHG
jgi:hypothetical protein